ncbi:hypothetical protein KSF78_0009754 [Schistosoma japonicum]|nr:hypothetical protein KSF78_0009754 [Schistosoma japonicum]
MSLIYCLSLGEDEDKKSELDSDKTRDSLVSTTTVANVTVEDNVESSSVNTQNNNMLTTTKVVAKDEDNVESSSVNTQNNNMLTTTKIVAKGEDNVESSSVNTQNNNMLTTTKVVAKDGEDEDKKSELDSDKTRDSHVSTTTVANVTVGELKNVYILSNKSIHTTYILTCMITIEYIK